MSEKSLRNQANHGFLAWAEGPRGRKGALPLERMRQGWRAEANGSILARIREGKMEIPDNGLRCEPQNGNSGYGAKWVLTLTH